MRDFSLEKYEKFIVSLKNRQFDFQTFADCIMNPAGKSIILRHDVDRFPINALKMAEIEKKYGVLGSYYFRTVPESYDEEILIQIAEMGHEIGFHYETMDKITSGPVYSGNVTGNKDEIIDRAYDLFCKELEEFRKIVDVKTICMHGSPKGKWDNRMIWGKYDYKQLGITGEPYFDIDWNNAGYLTDTGRRWNGDKFSIRDKVNSKFKFDFKTTDDIIAGIDKLPDKLMITIHPQRWNDLFMPWMQELAWQNIKNFVKWVKIKNLKLKLVPL